MGDLPLQHPAVAIKRETDDDLAGGAGRTGGFGIGLCLGKGQDKRFLPSGDRGGFFVRKPLFRLVALAGSILPGRSVRCGGGAVGRAFVLWFLLDLGRNFCRLFGRFGGLIGVRQTEQQLGVGDLIGDLRQKRIV